MRYSHWANMPGDLRFKTHSPFLYMLYSIVRQIEKCKKKIQLCPFFRGVYIAQKLKLFRGHQKLFRGCNIRSLTFTSTVKPHSFEGCHDIYMNISNMTSVCTSGIAASCHVSPSILPCMCTGELSIYSNKWIFLILE